MNHFLLFFLATVVVVCAQPPAYVQFETCNDAETLRELEGEPLQTPKLLFSSSFLPCADSNFQGPLQELNCTGTYTRYSFVLPIRSTQQANGIPALQMSVNRLGTRGSSCLTSPSECNSQGCRHTNEMDFTIFHTRLFMKYSLVKVVPQVPFSFLPINGNNWGAGSGCTDADTGAATCTGQRALVNAICDPAEIVATYPGDFTDLNARLNASCGSLRDPATGPVDSEDCSTVCCRSCGSRATNTYSRNWAIGPVCGVYQINPNPQYVTGMFVRMAAAVTDLPKVINATMLFPTPQSVRLGTYGKMRIYVNGMLFPPLQSLYSLSGYVVLCNYENESGNIDQGRFNPNIERESWFQDLLDNIDTVTLADLENFAPFGTPSGANPITYFGAGKVPTQSSQNGTISWFYVPQSVVDAVALNETNYNVASQSEILDMNENACSFDSNDYFGNYVGVPGWALDSTGQPTQPSICQMSNQVNEWARIFALYIANGTSPADAAAAISSLMPPWIPPPYTINQPNMWINNGSLMLDVSTIVESTASLNIFVDISDEYITNSEIQDAFSINSGLSKCKINGEQDSSTVTGLVVVYANALDSVEGASGLVVTVRCFNDSGVEFPISPEPSQLLQPATGSAGLVSSPPFTYVTNTSFLGPYSAGFCNITINYPATVLDGLLIDQKTVKCTYILRAGLIASAVTGMLADQPIPFEENNSTSTDNGSGSLGTGSIIAICLVFGIALIILVAFVATPFISAKMKKKNPPPKKSPQPPTQQS
jgi:hypothetical protein